VSNIIPLEYNVLVLPDPVEEQTKGGIIIPQKVQEQEQHAATKARIIAVSPLAFTYENWPEGARIAKEGDHVLIARYAGSLVDPDKPDGYRIIKDKDVLAVIED
jgi:co-chaperonin GroES (HSP10)